MATPNDYLVTAILADMRQPSTSNLSNQVSHTKRQFRPKVEIPASQSTTDGFRSLRNRIAYLETRHVKAKKSLCPERTRQQSSCPVGLQCRARPHQNFNTDLQNICIRAEWDLPQLMIQHQEHHQRPRAEINHHVS